MSKKLQFLTKELIDLAAKEIDKNGVPANRSAKDYEVVINKKHYPFKLIITTASELDGGNLKTNEFSSSEKNRNWVINKLGYKIKMTYFDIDKVKEYSSYANELYNDNKKAGLDVFNHIRPRLQEIGSLLGLELNVELYNNYNAKANQQAAGPHRFKNYILAGFIPSNYKEFVGESIFLKIFIDNFIEGQNPNLGLNIDIKNIEENNIFEGIKDNNPFMLPINDNFPQNWNELIDIVKNSFNSKLNELTRIIERKIMEPNLIEYKKILLNKKQIILQGPSGTGKTYTAKNIAEELIYNSISNDKKIQKGKLEESSQFSLVQFHPSYSYEDFVRSITAKSEGGNIVYETENKIFATFAQNAMDNLNDVNKDVKELSKEQQIQELLLEYAERVQEKIDIENAYPITPAVSILDVETDAFRYTGDWKVSQRMKFSDLVHAQLSGVTTRKELKNLTGVSGLAKHHASYYIKVLNDFQNHYKNDLNKSVNENIEKPKLKKYILVIDEINRANLSTVLGELIYALEYRNESVQSMYALDGDNSITIPENLYIIGTMNTADRSVGHIDYAIKRRFAFVDVLPNEDVIDHVKAKELFKKVASLFVKEENGIKSNSDYLAPDFDYKDVQLGHSYFILSDNSTGEEQKAELEMRLKYEILPILNDYVRDGLLLETAKENIKEIAKFEC